MNIFFVDKNAIEAATNLVDSHVVKMILESCQLLSTAHRLLDGQPVQGKTKTGRKVTWYILPDDREKVLYQATHINHPSSVWVRKSNNNYTWLHAHLLALLNEYTYRYGKIHKCTPVAMALISPPRNISVAPFTPPTPAMKEEFLVGKDSLKSYRNYYIKGKVHLHKYTKRHAPQWLMENTDMAIYTFRNKKTGEEVDISMPISEIVDYEKSNPHLERVYSKMNIVDPVGIGITRPPSDFSKYVLGKVKAANPHTEVGKGRWDIKKEV
jgi:hypothetical protein